MRWVFVSLGFFFNWSMSYPRRRCFHHLNLWAHDRLFLRLLRPPQGKCRRHFYCLSTAYLPFRFGHVIFHISKYADIFHISKWWWYRSCSVDRRFCYLGHSDSLLKLEFSFPFGYVDNVLTLGRFVAKVFAVCTTSWPVFLASSLEFPVRICSYMY